MSTPTTTLAALPVAVIGAGPVGLAAAAHLALGDQAFVVFESGAVPGAAVAEWRHVTFFSPWRYVVDVVDDPVTLAASAAACGG